MELSKLQIDNIDQFLKDQKVRFLDLRLELIDHIATHIESKKYGSDYNKAIDSLPKHYYPSQLIQIKEKKALALGEFWDKELKVFWRSYLTIPKVFITLILVLILSLAGQIKFNWLESDLLALTSTIVSFVGIVLCLGKFIKVFNYKALLFENSLYVLVFILSWSGSGMYELTKLVGFVTGDKISTFILAFYTTFQIITLIGLFTEFPKFIHSKMKTTYG